jgi:hypothetical protein
MTIHTGRTLDAHTAHSYSLTISSGWVNNGTYLACSSSVTFVGADTGNTIKSGGSNFYKILINGPGSWTPVTNPITVSSTVVVASGTLTLTAGSTMTVL